MLAMSDLDTKRAWVGRVLGIQVSAKAQGASKGTVDSRTPRAVWLAAKEEVDGRLEALARELRTYGDPDLDQVAEFGLFGLSGGRETVGLTVALLELEGAPPERHAAAKAAVAKAVLAYRAGVLDGNELVKIVDDNPFDIDVALHRTLDSALTQIERAIT